MNQATKGLVISKAIQESQDLAPMSQVLAQILQKILSVKKVQEGLKQPSLVSSIIQAYTWFVELKSTFLGTFLCWL